MGDGAAHGTHEHQLADGDTVAGTVRFATACAAAGVRPVFGVDVAVTPHSPPDARRDRRRTPVRGGAHVMEPPPRITLLAQNAAGWARLCRLVSAAHSQADGGLPVVSWAVLREFADQDLVVMLGPASEPVRALSAGRPDVAEQMLAPWRELAGAGLRLEAVLLGRKGTGPGSLRLAARTVGLADQLGVRAVLTNAVRYADADQHRIADVLDAARLLRPVDRRHLDGGERWLKDRRHGRGRPADRGRRRRRPPSCHGAAVRDRGDRRELHGRPGTRPRTGKTALPRAVGSGCGAGARFGDAPAPAAVRGRHGRPRPGYGRAVDAIARVRAGGHRPPQRRA